MDQQTAAAVVGYSFFLTKKLILQSEVKVKQIARKFLFDFVLKVNKLVKEASPPPPLPPHT